MKRTLVVKISTAVTMTLGFATTWAQEQAAEPAITPVETYTCKYNDGQGPADLEKVIDNWNAFMDEQNSDNYFAMTLTPHYFGGETFQVGWLGSAPTAEALGAGADNWQASGQEHAAAFAKVLTCDSHSNFATMEVKAPPERDFPERPVITFSDCSAMEGKSMDDVFTAMDLWTAYTTENGYQNGAWAMFPAYGVDDVDYDFKLVNSYHSHTELGKDYDRYANGGGYQKHGELLGDTLSCNVSRVYDGVVRRRIVMDNE